MNNITIKKMCFCAMFTALISALSQVAFPTPAGVAVTLQTFAVAVTGFVLGTKLSLLSTVCYILLGAAGVPVFAGFKGGIPVLFGASGGFIFGFPLFAVILSLVFYVNKPVFKILLCGAALVVLYSVGILQFVLVTGNGTASASTIFSPYFIKDVIVVIGAYFLCLRVRTGVLKFIQPK